MSRKVVKKTKINRVSSKPSKRVSRSKARGFNFAVLLVPVLVVVALGSFFILLQINNQAYAASSISPKGCVNDSLYSNQNVSTFVQAYQKGKSSKLTAYLECGGSPAWQDTFFEFDMSASNHKLQVSQYEYKDGQPKGKATKLNCTLKVVNSSTANLNCSNGKYAFNLYKS